MTGTWFLTDEYQAWRARAAFEHTINPPDFEYSSLYQALSHKFVTTVMVDNERLIKGGRFGTGWADDLMIVAITISEWAGYLDPTPTSDLINAALNGIDGNYIDAGMSRRRKEADQGGRGHRLYGMLRTTIASSGTSTTRFSWQLGRRLQRGVVH